MGGTNRLNYSGASDKAKPQVSRRIAAEAAVWVTMVSGSPADADLLLRCLAWQALSPSHRYAYERTKATWEDVGRLLRREGA